VQSARDEQLAVRKNIVLQGEQRYNYNDQAAAEYGMQYGKGANLNYVHFSNPMAALNDYLEKGCESEPCDH